MGVGTNVDVLEPLKEIKDMLPAVIPPGGKRMAGGVRFEWTAGITTQKQDRITFRDGKSEFAIATLEPRRDRPTRTILEDFDTKKPLAVQGAYGQGRVTIVAFDLDRGPLNEWGARRQFWDNMVAQAGYVIPSPNQKLEKYGTRHDEYTGALQGSLDFFEGVPVVSFGWVALFILIYIVLIGPVDYLFLKKVVKRLEWTWVTFPVIVITVSGAISRLCLEGPRLNQQGRRRDIDLVGKRIDRDTWFTLFSPRIHNYTIGVEPAAV